MRVSVTMATFNGMEFLGEQVQSILSQLRIDDELVVLDDASTDGTADFLENLDDDRVSVYKNATNQGHVLSFSKVLTLGSHPIRMMSDQDDRWTAGRLELLRSFFQTNKTLLVSSNTKFIDSNGNPTSTVHFPLRSADSDRKFINILNILTGRTGYYGCAMAVHVDLLRIALPIPSYVESHDLWLALVGNLMNANQHVDFDSLERRIHHDNASLLKRPLEQRVRSRLIHLRSIYEILNRIRSSNFHRQSQES